MLATRESRAAQRSRAARRSRPRLVGALTAAACALAVCVPASPAWADEPPFVGWTAVLPAVAGQYEPSSADDCRAGRTPCVRKVIRQMESRLDPLVSGCSHSAVFALAYLRTTQTYLEAAETPAFYRDPSFVNHQAVAFAAMYFDAYDDWAAGRVDRVPPAWRLAFRAADDRTVSGTGDLLLGMNAHVNRDLPFVLAAVGLVDAEGRSRKPDHDQANRMLNRAIEPILTEASARLDPSMGTVWTPYGIGYTGLMQTLLVWREQAWRNAELLVTAPDDAARARVAEAIETGAAATALTIATATRYLPPLTSADPRARHCAAHADAGA